MPRSACWLIGLSCSWKRQSLGCSSTATTRRRKISSAAERKRGWDESKNSPAFSGSGFQALSEFTFSFMWRPLAALRRPPVEADRTASRFDTCSAAHLISADFLSFITFTPLLVFLVLLCPPLLCLGPPLLSLLPPLTSLLHLLPSILHPEYNARIRGISESMSPQQSDRHRSYSFSGLSTLPGFGFLTLFHTASQPHFRSMMTFSMTLHHFLFSL